MGLFPGAINGPGNTTSWVHDGLGRVLAEVHDLRLGGTGAGALDTTNPANPDGRITLAYAWDANSRLAAIVDDKGNRTTFGYDELDRRTSLTWADGARHQFVFDRDDHLRQVLDPNGSLITRRLDALGRLIEVSVARAPGVAGTTRQAYAWDGVSRLVRASDDGGRGGLSDEVCEWIYDSLGRVLEERQNGRAVSSRWTGDGKRREVVYPGGRVIARTFDAIDRIQTLSDGSGPLAASEWIGPGLRELRRRNGNGTTLSFLDPTGTRDEGWDVVQRLVRLRCLSPGGVPFVEREYGYGRAGQRVFERRHDDLGLTDRWSYDSAYRVVTSAYDQEGLPGATPRELLQSSYAYDGVGNRVRRSEERAGAAAQAGLLARERLELGVGAVARGGAQVEDGPASSLALGPEARVEGDAAARRATLLPRGRITGRLSADRVELRPGAVVGALGPYSAGESLPAVPAPQAGALDVTVPPNHALTLVPGSYRRLAVRPGARLTLRAGAYEAAALEVDPGAEVRCEGAVTVRVGAFGLGSRGRVELAPGAAGSIRVEVAGGEAIAVGEEALLAGALIAPRAEVRVGERAEVRGRVLAGAVVLGPGAAAGEPGAGGGGRRVESTDYAVDAVNAYTRVGGVARTHDANGNLTDDGSRVLVWDAFNRLVGVARKSDGAPIAAYFYLPDGRRSRKVVYSQTNPGVVERETRFVWDGAQEVEEQSAVGVTEATYVWSPVYVDELVEFRREAAHLLGAGSFYAHQDARCDVVAVTNASGMVVEKRRHDDFGREEIRDAGGAVVAASPSELEYGFQGRRRDAETGWLYFRARYYSAEEGRFLSRDPVWDAANVGGWYSFAGNGPVSGRDPSGRQFLGGFVSGMRDAYDKWQAGKRWDAITTASNTINTTVSNIVSLGGAPAGQAVIESAVQGGVATYHGLWSGLTGGEVLSAAGNTGKDLVPGLRSGQKAYHEFTDPSGSAVQGLAYTADAVGELGLAVAGGKAWWEGRNAPRTCPNETSGRGVVRNAEGLLENRMPESLAGELEVADALQVKPLSPGDPGFAELVATGDFKWVVTKDGKPVVVPKRVDFMGKPAPPDSPASVEMKHTVASRGEPVQAGGEVTRGKMTDRTGHYHSDDQSLPTGRRAFEEHGFRFD